MLGEDRRQEKPQSPAVGRIRSSQEGDSRILAATEAVTALGHPDGDQEGQVAPFSLLLQSFRQFLTSGETSLFHLSSPVKL